MSRGILDGKWKQGAEAIKGRWGKLTDDDLKVIAGRRDYLLGRLQEKYGMAEDQAEEDLADFEREYRELQAAAKASSKLRVEA